MGAVAVERRVTNLEELMAQLIRTVDRVDRQVNQTSRELRELQAEMRDFKAEMRDFKDEMLEFKDEMRAFKEDSLAYRREMNKKWGELANKMGTMAEDLVAPSIPRILRETVGCPDDHVDRVAVRVRVTHPADRHRMREFDVMALCGDYVLINETRSRLTTQYVEDFVQRLPEARDFFPEYADKKFIGSVASLYVEESVVRYGEQQGVIVLGFGEDVMEVLNTPGFKPRAF